MQAATRIEVKSNRDLEIPKLNHMAFQYYYSMKRGRDEGVRKPNFGVRKLKGCRLRL